MPPNIIGLPPSESAVSFVRAPVFADTNLLIDQISGLINLTTPYANLNWKAYSALAVANNSRTGVVGSALFQNATRVSSGYRFSFPVAFDTSLRGKYIHLVPFNVDGEGSLYSVLEINDRGELR